MKKKKKELTRASAMLLAALLAVNSVDLPALTSYAAQSEYAQETTEQTENTDGKETAGHKAVVTITGFDELEESITKQQLAIGAGEEEIVFPDTLNVTVSVVSSRETAETDTEAEESETSETEEAGTEEAETEEAETEEAGTEEAETEEAGTEEAGTEEAETEEVKTGEAETEETVNEESGSEEETGETEAEEKETTESESVETETVTTEQDAESDEDTEDTQNSETEEIKENNTFLSVFAPLTVYAAEIEDTATEKSAVITENSENTEKGETKEITLSDITWEIDAAESDGEVFDSSEECDGYCYVYTPVLPETDAEGNTLTLGEDVETPVIYVLIGESEHISLTDGAESGGFTVCGEVVPGTDCSPTVHMTYNPRTTLSDIDLNTAGTDNTTGITVTAGSVTGADGKALPGTWSWDNPSQVPQVNNEGYQATFTPNDTTNDPVVRTITVTVAKATPYIDGTPTAARITYGQTLKESTVQGNVYYDSTKLTGVAGNFVWENENTKPTAKNDSNSKKYTVIFKPVDDTNYNEVEKQITITVDKAQNAPNMPGSTMSVQNSKTKVGDVALPSGWVWEELYKDIELEVKEAQKATALYEGADKGNYIKESVEITITRSACDHVAGEILYTGIGEYAPDCENTGLGHRECTKCHEVTESSIVVAASGHRGGTANCTKKAVCTVCRQEYGTANPNYHAATEVRGHKNEDCTSAGYTGDTYCVDCGTKLRSGRAFAALGHNYKSEVTEQPTTTSTGVRTYTCARCGYSYTETIPKLPEETHSHSYTATITRQADCTNAGTKTYTCSCGDSYTESIPALGHHYVSRVTKEATVTDEGIMTYTCDRCGHSYTRPIAKLESNKSDSNKPGSDEPDGNQTDKTPGKDSKPGNEDDSGDYDEPIDTGRPETGKPYIEGREDENGWEKIKQRLETAKEENTVIVEMNGTNVVPGYIFDTIKGKDVSVVFDMGDGIYWKVNGKDITEEKIGNIDFGVRVGSQAGPNIPVEIINKKTGTRDSMNLTLDYDGEFGFAANLTLNVGKKNAGMYANLFYYNPTGGELEYICADRIDKDGNAELTFTHASDYTIVFAKEDMKEAADHNGDGEDHPSVPETSDNGLKTWKMAWILLSGSLVMVIGIGTFYITRRKKEKE